MRWPGDTETEGFGNGGAWLGRGRTMVRFGNVSLFKKMLFSYVTVVFIPVMLITLIYLFHYHLELQGRIESSAMSEMSRLSSQVDTVVKNIKDLALRLSFSTELNKVLKGPSSANVYEYSTLKEFFRSQVSANDMLYSIYIYFNLNDKVLTTSEGIYPRKHFYDQEILNRWLEEPDEPNPYLIRTITDPLGLYKPVDVVSFRQTLPVGARYPLGSIIVNVKKKELFEAVEALQQSDHVYIFNEAAGELLHPSEAEAGAAVRTLLRSAGPSPDASGAELRVETVGGKRYFVVRYPAFSQPWTFIKLVPYDQYLEPLLARAKRIGASSAVVLMLGLLLSYLFAFMLYSPWKKIVGTVASLLKPPPEPKRMNEFALVNHSIQYLIRENEKIRATMKENQPMIKYRLIYDLLNNHVLEPSLALKQLA